MTCRGDRRSPLSGGHHARKSNAADGKKTRRLSSELTGQDTITQEQEGGDTMSARPMPTQETEPSAAKRFIAAARQLHVDEPDVDKRWQKMGPLLSEMLADPSVQSQSQKWPSCDQGGLAEGGQRAQNLLLYEDPDHGFVINGLVKAPGTRTSIHDHAHNWTLYGVLDGHETVERYERLDDGSKPDYAEVRKSENVQVGPGKIDLVGPVADPRGGEWRGAHRRHHRPC